MYSKNQIKLLTFLLTILGISFGAANLSAQIEAIGTCTGVTSDQNYRISITNLPAGTYEIRFNGAAEAAGITSSSYTSGDIAFVDGTTKTTVDIIEAATPLDTTRFIVNEVLCTDINVDGTMDFDTVICDYTKPVGAGGAIVSTVAPFTGTNVYLYLLVGSDDIYLTATAQSNNSGLFTDLDNDDYKVYAFNFLSIAEANSFLSSIPNATDLSTYTVAAPTCYALCGSASYTVDCQSIVDIYVDPTDYDVCMEGDAQFFIQDSIIGVAPIGTVLSYQWQVDDGGGWANTTDGLAPDSVLDLSNVVFADSGNMYRVIVTMTVGAATISMDTSGVGVLTVYDDPVLLASLDVTVNSDMLTGITMGVTPGSVPADSFEVVSVTIGSGLAADPGNATVPQVTVDADYIFDDTYTNIGVGPDTAFYEIVAISEHGCRGDTITVFVEVRPCPMVSDLAEVTICSGDVTGVSFPKDDDNELSIDSFAVTAVAGSAIGGTPTIGTTTDDTYVNGDIFTNTSDAVDSVVYTIVPYANDCAGESFEVVVMVDPEPVFADIDTDQCSDVAIAVNLAFADDTGLNIDSVTITASVGDSLTGTATTGTGITTTGAIAGDIFTNTSSVTDSVVYTVTPYSGDCVGESYTITVRITTEPVGTDPTPIVCSDESFSIDLSTLITNGGATPSFTWVASSNLNVEGEETTLQATSTLTDQLSNTTNVDQDVVYTVTPTSTNSCVGDPFTVTVTVHPEPVSTDQVFTICSDDILDVDLSDSLQNTVAIQGYIYTVSSSDQANVPAGAARTDTTTANITDTYTNTTNAAVLITYTVTPISTDGCAGAAFDVDVTINPEPILASTLDDTVCSESAIGVTLAVEGGSVAANNYEIVSISPAASLVAGAVNSTAPYTVSAATSADTLANESWSNTTTGSLDVTYSVAPISSDGCRGDTVDITITIDPMPVVDAGSDETICSTEKVDLTGLGATITGGASNGTWSSSTGGVFDGGTTFSTATTYTPSTADKDAGGVTLTLTSDDPSGTCGTESDTVFIEILDIRCSEFPWKGND